MKEKLDSFISELNSIDAVLDKLESKSNVSVFEKLCGNCNRVFLSFCELDIKELVADGLARQSIDFLTRLKGQVIRLKHYKEALTAYIEMTEANKLPEASQVAAMANNINEQVNGNVVSMESKKLDLAKTNGNAA